MKNLMNWMSAFFAKGVHEDRWLDKAIADKIKQSTNINSYKDGVARTMKNIHLAGLDVGGITQLATVGQFILNSENESFILRAMNDENIQSINRYEPIFDINQDYINIILVKHARGNFIGLYYLPVEFNGHISNLNKIRLSQSKKPVDTSLLHNIIIDYEK